ncbi:MAG: hypothetical protein PVF34_09660 [Gammaproteobacteria bacterium]|jgi:hypothetical protein
MYIDSPLDITVRDDETNTNRELYLTFKSAFIQKELFERVEEFQQYIDQLKHDISKLPQDNPDRLGLETILDICENLREYIATDELDLNEQIVIEIQPSSKIGDNVSGGSTIH